METATDNVVDRTFAVGSSPMLELENVSGGIVIRAGESGVIEIHAEKRGGSGASGHVDVEMEQHGDRVVVRTRHRTGPFGLSMLSGGHGSVRYDVRVPRGCALRVKGVSSAIDAQGVGGPAHIHSVSGAISIMSAAGDIDLSTVSGAISAGDLVGNAMLKSTSGAIKVVGSRLDQFNASNVSGRIEVESPLVTGRLSMIRTVSGSVRVAVPADTAATVSMKSVSGDAQFDLPAQVIKAGRRSWQGVINGGGANLEVTSVSGSLRVTESSGTPAWAQPVSDTSDLRTPPVSHVGDDPAGAPVPAPMSSQESQEPNDDAASVEILRRLQLGEISIEEATAELERLERGGQVVEL